MTTLAFASDGRCICSVNVPVAAVHFTDAAKVIEIDKPISANEVWYDLRQNTLTFRKLAKVTLRKNRVLGLPEGTIALVNGETVLVDDGSLEIEVEYNQVISVVLMNPRFLDTTVEVDCEAAG